MAAVLVRLALSKLALRTKLAVLARVALGGAMLLALVLALTPVSVSGLVPAEYTFSFVQGSDEPETLEGAPMARLAPSLRTYVTQHARSATIPIGGGASEADLGRRLGIPNLSLITGMVIGAIIIVGHVPMLGRRGLRPSVSFYYLVYLVAILLWPWPLVRFLYPVQPFLLYALLLGVQTITAALVSISGRRPSPTTRLAGRKGAVAAAGLLLIGSILSGATDTRSSLAHTPDLRVGTTWIREHAPPDAKIMARRPQVMHLYTERTTVDYPDGDTEAELAHAIAASDVTYLLLAPRLVWGDDGQPGDDAWMQAGLIPAVDALVAAGHLDLVYESREDAVRVYHVLWD